MTLSLDVNLFPRTQGTCHMGESFLILSGPGPILGILDPQTEINKGVKVKKERGGGEGGGKDIQKY